MSLAIYGSSKLVGALLDANAVGFRRGKAIRFAHGTLSPGAYINNRTLPSHPEAWNTVLTAMSAVAKRLRPEYDIIAGVATGGISHSSVIARKLQVPYVTVKKQEKGHGLGGLIDGDPNVYRGKRALLGEDMSSTYHSSIEAMKALAHEGVTVSNTLLINTWNLPVFQANIGEHSVFAGCTGEMILDEAVKRGLVDKAYEKLIRNWLENPDDESWAHDDTWELPKPKAA